MSDSMHQRIVELDAERGTIYSEDGQMLSTSLPDFDIYIDFNADGLRDKKGKVLKKIWIRLPLQWPVILMIKRLHNIKRNSDRLTKRKPLLSFKKEIII